MFNEDGFKKGLFIEECSRRFSCIVKADKEEMLCYVASSSKLKHFIDLKNREVLLKRNKKMKSKTKYTLHAVQGASGYILLNLIFVNQLVMNKLMRFYQGDQIYREKKVSEELKADFYIEENGKKIVIEAKGLITENKQVNRIAFCGQEEWLVK
nr:hypothetical protein [uncultured Anaeromusa sp.]